MFELEPPPAAGARSVKTNIFMSSIHITNAPHTASAHNAQSAERTAQNYRQIQSHSGANAKKSDGAFSRCI